MDNTEKIIESLEKKSLSEEERQMLNSLIKNDPGAKKVYDTYKKLSSVLKSKHISYDDLRDYIFHKNNIEPENKNITEKVSGIELHLKECENCVNAFKDLSKELTDIGSFISQETPREKEDRVIPSHSFRMPAYTFGTIAAIVFIYLAFLFISDISAPANYDLASIQDRPEFYVTRGRATDDFQNSLKALEENNFEKAIADLQNDINKNPDDKTIFYSHYILGLLYLEKADKDFLGLFKSFDDDFARKGFENFQLCIEKNNSGLFPDVTYNACFYAGKASIMLGEIGTAKKNFEVVIKEKGSKMSEAQNILNELE